MGCSVGTYFTAYLQIQTHKALLTCRIGQNCSLFQACSGRFRNHTIFHKYGVYDHKHTVRYHSYKFSTAQLHWQRFPFEMGQLHC